MKVLIAYPPLDNQKGYPTLGQNRQFQYFKEPTYIYPMVPAYAATLLKQAGHEVIWLDCIAENISFEKFIEIIQKEKPDLIAFETKTPVVKQHWRIINDLKDKLQASNSKLQTVLFGDHVTALPEESFENSKVDFVLTGGDYDFLLLNLCKYLTDLAKTDKQKPMVRLRSPSALSEVEVPISELEPGIYYRDNGQVKNTGQFQLNHDLNSLPFIERDLTKWHLYAHKNGNYKLTPGTYIMSGRDCWWGKCSFCSWPTLYPKYRTRAPEIVLNEIEVISQKYKVREIMDDTGCFPAGDWLKDFCGGMLRRGLNKKIYFDCNMRFGALSYEDFALMKKANFRLLLFGLESANQATLDRINKNLNVEKIEEDCKAATKAGLFPHITIMFGYPWESYEEALKTLDLGRMLLKKGLAYTMQATIVIPYPGSPLFEECKQKNWLKTLNWDDYDMKQPVMQTGIEDAKIMELVQCMYKISFQPEFILRKLFSMRDMGDLKYFLRASKKVGGHVIDFKKEMAR